MKCITTVSGEQVDPDAKGQRLAQLYARSLPILVYRAVPARAQQAL
jgi:hypothetical protein